MKRGLEYLGQPHGWPVKAIVVKWGKKQRRLQPIEFSEVSETDITAMISRKACMRLMKALDGWQKQSIDFYVDGWHLMPECKGSDTNFCWIKLRRV